MSYITTPIIVFHVKLAYTDIQDVREASGRRVMDREVALRELESFRVAGGWYLPATGKWIRRINGVFHVIDDRRCAVTNTQIVEMVRIECRVQREVGF